MCCKTHVLLLQQTFNEMCQTKEQAIPVPNFVVCLRAIWRVFATEIPLTFYVNIGQYITMRWIRGQADIAIIASNCRHPNLVMDDQEQAPDSAYILNVLSEAKTKYDHWRCKMFRRFITMEWPGRLVWFGGTNWAWREINKRQTGEHLYE